MADAWVAFIDARLAELAEAVEDDRSAPPGAMRFLDVDQWGERLSWLADGDLAAALVAAMRVILSEHQPTEQAAYGNVCSRCRLRDDEPIPDGHHWVPWPCPTVRAAAGIWPDYPDYPGQAPDAAAGT